MFIAAIRRHQENDMITKDPLSPSGDRRHIAEVLEDMAAQEGCDGAPYDQMVEAARYICHLEAENAELKRDKARLDWLEWHNADLFITIHGEHCCQKHLESRVFSGSYREAIDKAMGQSE